MLDRIRAHRTRITTALFFTGLLGLGASQVYDRYYGDDCCAPGAPCCHPGSPCCHHGNQNEAPSLAAR